MTEKPGKRIVSRGEYVTQVFRKTGMRIGSISLILVALFIFLTAFSLAAFAYIQCSSVCQGYGGCVTNPFPMLTLAGLIAILGATCVYASFAILNETYKIQVDIPLTRANAAHLPAIDSLVRPSQEPIQSQETVLLRAATETTERQEQLLRASGGQN